MSNSITAPGLFVIAALTFRIIAEHGSSQNFGRKLGVISVAVCLQNFDDFRMRNIGLIGSVAPNFAPWSAMPIAGAYLRVDRAVRKIGHAPRRQIASRPK
ncbi:MAG: hypothetical protein HPM95_15165 [Alphaproteobacteria bacterium]|nr:hypothetical protein [Alphaproteobacteria bacterium]